MSSALDQFERSLIAASDALYEATHSASTHSEKTVDGHAGATAIEEVEHRPSSATREGRGRRWGSLWSGGRLGIGFLAIVLAGGAAAAGVLLDQPSAPLAGRVPAGQQPGYAVAGGYRYRISLVPSLQVGQIGWCAAITTTSKIGQPEDLGTGACDDAPTSGAPLFAPQLGQGLSSVFTTAAVHAIQLPGERPVLTTSAGLPFGYRAAVFQYVQPARVSPRQATGGQFGVAALDASDRRIPYDQSGMPNEPIRIWGHAQKPAPGSCSVTADPGAKLTFGVGSVVTSLVAAPDIVGDAFLPCLERDVRLDSSLPTSLPISERVMQIYVLLDAKDPSAPAGPLPYLRPLAGHPAILNNAQVPLPDALSNGMTARRAGNAWLVVVGGRSTQERLTALSQLSLADVNLRAPETSGSESHGCSLTYAPTTDFTETGTPFGATPGLSYRLDRTCASTTFYFDSRWPLTASVERATTQCPAAPLIPCRDTNRPTRLHVSKVQGHAGEWIVSIAGIERATVKRIVRGWLIVRGGKDAAQQQLLLSRLGGNIALGGPSAADGH